MKFQCKPREAPTTSRSVDIHLFIHCCDADGEQLCLVMSVKIKAVNRKKEKRTENIMVHKIKNIYMFF